MEPSAAPPDREGDAVEQGSLLSFPASDPPAWVSANQRIGRSTLADREDPVRERAAPPATPAQPQ
jgi:hypothetical protein